MQTNQMTTGTDTDRHTPNPAPVMQGLLSTAGEERDISSLSLNSAYRTPADVLLMVEAESSSLCDPRAHSHHLIMTTVRGGG